jgi:hypothetical protein
MPVPAPLLSSSYCRSLAPFRGRGKSRVAAKGEGGRASVSERGVVGRNASGGRPPLPNPSPPEGGEGLFGSLPISAQFDQNRPCDALYVGHHITVREADDAVALAFDEGGAGRVIGLASGVAVTIKFDHEAQIPCRKIGDIGRNWGLLDEFDALQPPCAKSAPQFDFRGRHLAAELFGAVACRDIAFGHNDSPLSLAPLRSTVPLLVKGTRDVTPPKGSL